MKKNKTDLIIDLQEICHELGWAIAIKDDENCTGLIIGTMSFIKDIAEQLEDADQYDLLVKDTVEDKSNLH